MWRIQMALTFDDRDEANDFYRDITIAIPKASPQTDDFVSWHTCNHQPGVNKPCEVIAEWQPL
jgi:hypothetical protein